MERFLFRMAIALAAAVAAIILSSVAAVFFWAAFYLYLVSLTAAPPLAALVVGLATLTMAALIILTVAIVSRRRTEDRRIYAVACAVGQANNVAANLGGLAARELTSFAQAHPYRTFVLALLGGLAVGCSPDLREMLRKALQS